MDFDKSVLSFLKHPLLEQVLAESSINMFPKGTEILREEQYVKVLPIVLEGIVKVYSRFNDKELLLYYIQPSQSCVMTFYASLKNTPSKVYASIEEDAKILLVPVRLLPKWLNDFPDFNQLFYDQFNLRYSELLDTIGHLLTDRMDKRLYEHLKNKAAVTNSTSIKMSHSQIANELGTAREVISRILKKLEIEGKLTQDSGEIKLI